MLGNTLPLSYSSSPFSVIYFEAGSSLSCPSWLQTCDPALSLLSSRGCRSALESLLYPTSQSDTGHLSVSRDSVMSEWMLSERQATRHLMAALLSKPIRISLLSH